MVQRIWMFFNLKPSSSQGESSLKISARRFGGVREQTNKQTDSLTDWCFDREKNREDIFSLDRKMFSNIRILLDIEIIDLNF